MILLSKDNTNMVHQTYSNGRERSGFYKIFLSFFVFPHIKDDCIAKKKFVSYNMPHTYKHGNNIIRIKCLQPFLFLRLLLIHKSILYLSSVSPAHILLLELLLKLSTFLLVHEEDLRARTIHLVPHKVHVSHLFKSCVLSLTPTAENRGVWDDRTHLSIASLSCSLCKI